jgi:acyl dehydratase
MTVALRTELLDVQGIGSVATHGLEKVRFVSPVPVGSRIRMGAIVAEVSKVKGGWQLTVDETIEVEGGVKPVMVARALTRFFE